MMRTHGTVALGTIMSRHHDNESQYIEFGHFQDKVEFNYGILLTYADAGVVPPPLSSHVIRGPKITRD